MAPDDGVVGGLAVRVIVEVP
jgi:hypothetical protein